MKTMENKLEFKQIFNRLTKEKLPAWELIYSKEKKIPCTKEEKRIYGVSYKYESDIQECYIRIWENILIDSKSLIYEFYSIRTSQYDIRTNFISPQIYCSNLDNAKRMGLCIAKCDLADIDLDLDNLSKKTCYSDIIAKEKELEEYEALYKKP